MSDLETTDTPDRLRIKGFGSLRLPVVRPR